MSKGLQLTLEERVEFRNSRRDTEVDRLVTNVNDDTAENRGVDLKGVPISCENIVEEFKPGEPYWRL